jgi:DNA-binding response OmpR family regulator
VKRILVVDDHADTREYIEMLLRTGGYDVTTAADGEDGTQAFRRRPAEIVIVDIFMPRKDGIETINDLRREFPGVKIIAMSADSTFGLRNALVRARDAGADLVVRKPLEPWVLLRSVEQLAGQRRAAV